MSEIKYSKVLTKGTESELSTTPVKDGKLRFTTDTGKVFLDVGNSRREISDLVKKYTENQIKAITDPFDKIYISSDTHKLFIYTSKGWVVCGESNGIVDKALEADHSSKSDDSINAATAEYAEFATNASTAEYAINAGVANYSANSGTASYAKSAGTTNIILSSREW